jgi:hypothetical protein
VVPVGEVVAALSMVDLARSGSRVSQALLRAKTSPLLLIPVTPEHRGLLARSASDFLEQAAI